MGNVYGNLDSCYYVPLAYWFVAQFNASIDNTADFSAAGPTVDGRWKPDIVAPGEDVLSAVTPAYMGRSPPSGADRRNRLVLLFGFLQSNLRQSHSCYLACPGLH